MSVYCFIIALIVRVYVNHCQFATVQLSTVQLPYLVYSSPSEQFHLHAISHSLFPLA